MALIPMPVGPMIADHNERKPLMPRTRLYEHPALHEPRSTVNDRPIGWSARRGPWEVPKGAQITLYDHRVIVVCPDQPPFAINCDTGVREEISFEAVS